jgi:hypothetical protein
VSEKLYQIKRRNKMDFSIIKLIREIKNSDPRKEIVQDKIAQVQDHAQNLINKSKTEKDPKKSFALFNLGDSEMEELTRAISR